MFNKQFLAKLAGWLGGVLVASSQSNVFGKYSGLAGAAGGVLVSLGIHNASATSADNPAGK